jgi:hypothetical protein
MKPIRALIATAIFMALLLSAYMAHVSLFRVNVVFYAAIGDALIASVAAAAVLFLMKFFRCLSGFEKVLLVVIWLLGGYTFAISIPTVIDRSLSFYILEKLQQRGGGIRQDSFARVFTDEYLIEHRLVDVRLTEQLESGTIEIENGCVRLTERGERVASFSRYFRQNWLPKKRLLMGKYSDDLTDPFRHSQGDRAYTCR